MGNDFNLKIADFGFSKFYENSNQNLEDMNKGLIVGTSSYMAPEMFNCPNIN